MTETPSQSNTPLPGAERAVSDRTKLHGYALDPTHQDGGADKAKVFRSELGLEQDDWEHLRDQLLAGVQTGDATPKGVTPLGDEKYEVVVNATGRTDRSRP